MNDPHVEKLIYRLECLNPNNTFQDPSPITGETDVFRWNLESETLTFEFKQHFAHLNEAQASVKGFLRAWELDDALEQGRPIIKFSYKDAEIIDRNPPPPGTPQEVILGFANLQQEENKSKATATVSVSRTTYPVPPNDFEVSPDVETMWNRYIGYLEGREPLQSMAYFCLTVIEIETKGKNKRKQAAVKYNIDYDVLNKLGELSSERGDTKTARKATISAPLSPKEEAWIKETIRRLIRRVGELDKSSSLNTITMDDLPQL